MFKWLNKIFAVKSRVIVKQKPLMLVPSKKDLSKMTKKDLEALGRKHKIELDRRLTKDKLVNALHKHIKSLNN